MRKAWISNNTTPLKSVEVRLCESFFSRFSGLMGRKSIGINEGILLVESSDSRINTSIHMFFMNFDIAVIWIDSRKIVVDKVLARKWRPFYAPSTPCQFTLETHPGQLDSFQIGDQVAFLYG